MMPPAETWLGKFVPLAGAQRTLGRARRALDLVLSADVEGQVLLQRFLSADGAAGMSANVVGRACRDLLTWSRAQPWTQAEKKQFQLMIVLAFKVRVYGRAAMDVRLDRTIDNVASVTPDRASRVMGTLMNGGWELAARGGPAFEAFRRILDVSPLFNPRWEWLIRELDSLKISRLVEDARRMREALRQLPDGATFADLIKKLPAEHARLVGVRGALAEIYAAGCRIVRQELDRCLANAAFHAARMGEPWEAVKAMGTIMLDGNKSYDQAVLLVNRVTGEAILHTGVQIKAEKTLSAFKKQLPNDVSRETWGKFQGAQQTLERSRLPVISIDLDGQRLPFSLRPTPPEMTTRRLVFFAEGGAISPSDAAALAKIGIEGKAIALDMSMRSFERLTLEFIDMLKSLPD